MQQRFETLVPFYAGTMRPERQAAFLRSEPIDYVLYGPFEQVLAAARWQPGPLLKPVFRAGKAIVYKVERR